MSERPLPARLLPHNLEAEESVLGAMLLTPNAIADAVNLVRADDFYKPAHGHVFDAICAVYQHGTPADPVVVADELSRRGLLEQVGGSGTLVALQAGTPTTTNAAHYARIVEEHATLRRLVGVSSEVAELAYSLPSDPASALDEAEARIFALSQRRRSDTIDTIDTLLAAGLDRLEMLYEKGDAVTGLATGWARLDRRLNGLQPGALYIVGARPAMGKTAFALGLATEAAFRQHTPVLFFSLEMSDAELVQRIIATEARVDATRLRNGRLDADDWRRITAATGDMAGAPLHVDHDPYVNLLEMRARARRIKSRHGLGLVVVDYLQLMEGRKNAETRQVEVAEISRGLKLLARELDVPVVALSQLSRNLEQRADRRPMLADLRESGSLEADADVVMFLYRDEVYNRDTIDKAVAEVIVAKHRSGPIGTERLVWLEHETRFVDTGL